MATSVKNAIKHWESKHKKTSKDAAKVKLMALMPPIVKMDANMLNSLAACEHLSLSSNSIERMVRLELPSLRSLSLGRNRIKRVDGLQAVAGTLEQLWLSYNEISSLDGLLCCGKLKTLFISHNKIKTWEEVAKLKAMDTLEDVLLVGNPIYSDGDLEDETAIRIREIQCCPQITKIDSMLVTPLEREKAKQ